jgi:hypothetical protein
MVKQNLLVHEAEEVSMFFCLSHSHKNDSFIFFLHAQYLMILAFVVHKSCLKKSIEKQRERERGRGRGRGRGREGEGEREGWKEREGRKSGRVTETERESVSVVVVGQMGESEKGNDEEIREDRELGREGERKRKIYD